MTLQELDGWWASLTVKEKERIAEKAMPYVLLPNIRTTEPLSPEYPHCTDVWNALGHEVKEYIYHHLTDDHGVIVEEWQEGKMMSE